MNIEEREEREKRQAAEAKAAKARAAQFRRDVQDVFGTEAARRVLWAFLAEARLDYSPLRDDAALTAHAIGWQDSARWWLEQLRQHCPEREPQMRKEAAQEAARGAPQDPTDED